MIDESTPEAKREIRALFDTLGVDYAEVEFSGGNDEGGADMIWCVMRGTGERVAAEVKYVDLKQSWDRDRRCWVDGPETAAICASISPATKLANLLDDVPSWKYGTFAGDYYVSGTITIRRDDANGVRALFSGSEEVPTEEAFEEEF